jgi:predicted nucleic acid-binding protein
VVAFSPTTCYLDTNIFLNVIYDEPGYSKGSSALLHKIQEGTLVGITSAVTETEIGLDLANTGNSERIDRTLRLLERLENLTISPLGSLTARLAVRLTLERGMTVHDAYHSATAIESRTSVFVTRDRQLRNKLKDLVSVSKPEDLLEVS